MKTMTRMMAMLAGATYAAMAAAPAVSGDVATPLAAEASPLAEPLAEAPAGEVTVSVPANAKGDAAASLEDIDLAAPRAESYPAPGSLPEVRPASVQEDLGRRKQEVEQYQQRIDSDRRQQWYCCLREQRSG